MALSTFLQAPSKSKEMHRRCVDIPIICNYKDLVSVYFSNYKRIAETILVIAGRIVSEGNVVLCGLKP
jgi:hypothetical protein